MSEEIRKIVREEIKNYLGGPGDGPPVPRPPQPTAYPHIGQAPPGGFPTTLPYAKSMALPSALLRPLKQPIHDSEWYPKEGVSTLNFFQRQVAQTFAHQPPVKEGENDAGVKQTCDTTLTQPGTLPNPLEFSIFGFSLHFHGISKELRDEITQDAEFMFLYAGNRIYLNTPLFNIPDQDDPLKNEYVMPTVPDSYKMTVDLSKEELERHQEDCDLTYARYLEEMRLEADHGQRFHNFTVGRSALRMRPTESFGIRMNWPRRKVPVEEMFKIYVFIHGLMWTPL